MKKNKEIAQLRKASRKQENYIKSLEADNRLKNVVLKRKTEEIAVLKRAPKQGLSNKAAGRLRRKVGAGHLTGFSPIVVKNKWQNLEQSINKVAYNKQTVSSMERDMERWLKEQELLSRQLERIMRKRERSDPSDITSYNDMKDQVEALKANIDYIHENIRECQENIMRMEESKETSELIQTDKVTSGLGMEETHHLVSKLIAMTISQATLAAQRQAEISELEGKMKQYEQTTSVQEQLLAHVLGDKDMEVYSLMSSLVAAEDNMPASAESSRSNSPTDGRDKARRKTATTEDMLFNNGSEKNGNASGTDASGTDASANTPPVGTIVGAMPIVALERLAAERAALDRMSRSHGADRMTASLEETLSEDGLFMPPPSGSHRAVPRVTSAPNPLNDCTIGMWRMRTSYDVSPELSDWS